LPNRIELIEFEACFLACAAIYRHSMTLGLGGSSEHFTTNDGFIT